LNAAELDRRAWIGPLNANLLADLVKDQGIKIGVTYINTGREPWTNFIALAKPIVFPKRRGTTVAQSSLFSITEWRVLMSAQSKELEQPFRQVKNLLMSLMLKVYLMAFSNL